MLDGVGLLAETPRLCELFGQADEDDESPAEFAAELSAALRKAASSDQLSAEEKVAALELSIEWRDEIAVPADAAYLTVAQTAARFNVRPQAVYKWIKSDKIKSERSPGGGKIRIPAGQFSEPSIDRRRLDDLQRVLIQENAKRAENQS